MRRCFLCDGGIDVLARSRWELAGLGQREIGFGTCAGCGLALQAPCASAADLATWYGRSAVYTSPGRGGEPHPRKVRGVTRLLRMVEHTLGRMPASAFQAGSSDGYTLARFREAGVARVSGLDPSPTSVALATERRGVETACGAVEDAAVPQGVELWVLTHVLEHLLDPLVALRRAHGAGAAWVAVEVPLFERPDALPLGWLAFEHLTYFAEEPLVRALARAGFEVTGLEKQYEDDLYPVVAAVARRAQPRELPLEVGERERARARLAAVLARERARWAEVARRLEVALDPAKRTWLHGAGVFASQLLAETPLAATELAGVFDSSREKRGLRLGPHEVRAPGSVELGPEDQVVIASLASAEEIWEALAPARASGAATVRVDVDRTSC